MPSPVAHSLVSLTLAASKPEKQCWAKWVGFWIVLGNFADLDFIPGLLMGTPSRFHHGPTHSLLAAAFLAVGAYYAYPAFFKQRKASIWYFFSVSFSHLFLDLLTRDVVPPLGLPLFWPFNHTFYHAPFWVFLNMERSVHLRVLFSWHNLAALALEIGLTLPFLLGVLLKRHGLKIRERSPIPFRVSSCHQGQADKKEAL